MTRLRSEDALADLQHVSAWIERERTLALANKVTRKIYNAVQTLRRQPGKGRQGRLPGTRELVVPGTPYVVVYSLDVNTIQLLRVLHGAQDWPPSG